MIESILELLKSSHGACVVLGNTTLTYDRAKHWWHIVYCGKRETKEYVVEIEFEAVQILINVATQEAE